MKQPQEVLTSNVLRLWCGPARGWCNRSADPGTGPLWSPTRQRTATQFNEGEEQELYLIRSRFLKLWTVTSSCWTKLIQMWVSKERPCVDLRMKSTGLFLQLRNSLNIINSMTRQITQTQQHFNHRPDVTFHIFTQKISFKSHSSAETTSYMNTLWFHDLEICDRNNVQTEGSSYLIWHIN